MTDLSPESDDDDPRISPRELAAFFAGQYADAGWSRTDHYAWMSGLLLKLGITSLAELGNTLRPMDAEALTRRMDYRYPPGAGRRLDDALLWTYRDTYIGLRGNAHRVPALRARLEKMGATAAGCAHLAGSRQAPASEVRASRRPPAPQVNAVVLCVVDGRRGADFGRPAEPTLIFEFLPAGYAFVATIEADQSAGDLGGVFEDGHALVIAEVSVPDASSEVVLAE